MTYYVIGAPGMIAFSGGDPLPRHPLQQAAKDTWSAFKYLDCLLQIEFHNRNCKHVPWNVPRFLFACCSVVPSGPNAKRPVNTFRHLWLAPCVLEFRKDGLHRIRAALTSIFLRSGPGAQITDEIGEIPLGFHGYWRHSELFKGKRYRSIACFQKLSFRSPVRPYNVRI